jgi:hypothetical protein
MAWPGSTTQKKVAPRSGTSSADLEHEWTRRLGRQRMSQLRELLRDLNEDQGR